MLRQSFRARQSRRVTVRNLRRRPPAGTDVARLAGVSQKTVSRVVNGEPLVSEDVRRRVLLAAEELGYRPNSAARARPDLRPDLSDRVCLSRVWAARPGHHARRDGTRLEDTWLLARYHDYRRRGLSGIAGAIEIVLAQGAEGVVISEPIDQGPIELHVDVPVLIFGYLPGLRAPHVISVLNAGDRNAHDATAYLLSLGHQTVHHVAGAASWYASREQIAGWRRALRERDARGVAPIHGDWTAASGFEAGRQLGRELGVTAIFAANDDMAVGVIRGLQAEGRSVPNDVSVMGFDDVPLAAYLTPALSTVRYPFELGASRGIAALIEAIEHPEGSTPTIEEPLGELIIRESTAAPRPINLRGGATGGA